MFNNNRGQSGMMVGILILIMCTLIFISTLPAVATTMDNARGCSNLNCPGFVDVDATGANCTTANQSYRSDGNDNALSCTIMDLFIPILILGILVGLIGKLLAGKMAEEGPQYTQGY